MQLSISKQKFTKREVTVLKNIIKAAKSAAKKVVSVFRSPRGTWASISKWTRNNKRSIIIGATSAAAGVVGTRLVQAMSSDDNDQIVGGERSGYLSDRSINVSFAPNAHSAVLNQISLLCREISYKVRNNDTRSHQLNARYTQLMLLFSDLINSIPNDEYQNEARQAIECFIHLGRLGLTVDADASSQSFTHYFSTRAIKDETVNSVQESILEVLNLSGYRQDGTFPLRSIQFND